MLCLDKKNILYLLGCLFMMDLKATIPAKQLIEQGSLRKFWKKAFSRFLIFAEKYFGSMLLLEIPAHLQNIDPEMYKAVDSAFELKRLGLIEEVRELPRFPDEPFFFRYASFPPRVNSGGADLLSRKNALWKTIGETTERNLWYHSNYFFTNSLQQTSYEKVKKSAVDIFQLAGFSKEQKNEFDFLSFDEKTVFGWLPARSVVSGEKKWCPAQLVSSFYFGRNVKTSKNDTRKEPMLRWAITTGLATGQSLEEAVTKGILEVIERDAFMISYLNKLSLPVVDLEDLAEQDNDLQNIIRSLKRYRLEVYFVRLLTDFPVHAYLSIIIDRTGLGPAVAVGASTDFDLKKCLTDALSESLSVRMSLKNSLGVENQPLEKLDRRGRLRFWAQSENVTKIDFFLQGPKIKLGIAKNNSFFKKYKLEQKSFRRAYYKKKLGILKSELKRKKHEACWAELTDPDTKKLGFRCVQVVIPQLQPMHLYEAVPYFSGKRLKEVPKKFGYDPLEQINQAPHPFP